MKFSPEPPGPGGGMPNYEVKWARAQAHSMNLGHYSRFSRPIW